MTEALRYAVSLANAHLVSRGLSENSGRTNPNPMGGSIRIRQRSPQTKGRIVS